ncbi:hypothetical protein KKI24_21890 [bacterium]|nr:hypothetical protein [bacterium]
MNNINFKHKSFQTIMITLTMVLALLILTQEKGRADGTEKQVRSTTIQTTAINPASEKAKQAKTTVKTVKAADKKTIRTAFYNQFAISFHHKHW